MANKPSYKLAREERKGSGSIEIEPVNPGTKVVDKTKPKPHSETLVPPLKPGERSSPKIGPPDSPGSLHAVPGIAHPGDQSPSEDIVKT